MAARRHGDLGELARRGAVEFHVPARHHRVELRRSDRTGRHLELADQAELRHLLHARADPAAGVAGAAERQQHMVADAGADRGDGALDRGDRAGASHRRGRRKAQVGNAEIGDEVLGHRAALAIRDHAIDVGRLEAGILDRAQRRLELEGQRRAIGAAHVLGLADAGDGSYFAQGHGCTPRTAATQVMGFAVALPILRRGRCKIVGWVERQRNPSSPRSRCPSQVTPHRSRSAAGPRAYVPAPVRRQRPAAARSSAMPRASRCSRADTATIDGIAEHRAAEHRAVNTHLMRAPGTRQEFQPRQFIRAPRHAPLGDGCLAGGILHHVPAVPRAPPRERHIDRAMLRLTDRRARRPSRSCAPGRPRIPPERQAVPTGATPPTDSPTCPRPAGAPAMAPICAATAAGNQSSALGPPRGPGCTGSPGGLSSTT